MSWNHAPRVRFTPELWAKWQARAVVDERTLQMRAGIQEFRAMLARRDLHGMLVDPDDQKLFVQRNFGGLK